MDYNQASKRSNHIISLRITKYIPDYHIHRPWSHTWRGSSQGYKKSPRGRDRAEDLAPWRRRCLLRAGRRRAQQITSFSITALGFMTAYYSYNSWGSVVLGVCFGGYLPIEGVRKDLISLLVGSVSSVNLLNRWNEQWPSRILPFLSLATNKGKRVKSWISSMEFQQLLP